MELNREQIIKALECHANGCKCSQCPMPKRTKEHHLCWTELSKATLTLIKELTQAHEQLSESYDHLEKTKDELLAERSRLTEENERLRERVKAVEEGAVRSFESQQDLYRKVVDALNREKHEAIADTVRKFAERLKKYYNNLKGKTSPTLTAYHIDQIAKEMLETDQKCE